MKSKIKRKIENEIVKIINENKNNLGVIGANIAGDKILIPTIKELDEKEQDFISKKISEIILLKLDKLRESEEGGEISNLPLLTYITNPKMISIEI